MRSKKDEQLLLYLSRNTFVFLKYIGHKRKGTTLDVMIPPEGSVSYIPFLIDKLPVNIERILRPIK